MTKLETIQKYCTEVEVEVSEMTEEQRENLVKEMEESGLRFNRSEARYTSCLMYVFDL